MRYNELAAAAQPAAVVARVAQQAPLLAERSGGAGHAGHAGHAGNAPAETVRQATHRGHHIVIRTSYRIEVDGVPIEGHLGVTDDGQVHYHAVPNIGFASAVDMVKQLIDAFPDDFAHGGHGHGVA